MRFVSTSSSTTEGSIGMASSSELLSDLSDSPIPFSTWHTLSKSTQISSDCCSPIESTPSTFEMAFRNDLNEPSNSSPLIAFSASKIPSMSFSRMFPSSLCISSFNSSSSSSSHFKSSGGHDGQSTDSELWSNSGIPNSSARQ